MSAAAITAQEVFDQTVRSLPLNERLRLAALILDNLSRPNISLLETSDAWSNEDRRDLASFSLHYADALYPEQEELV